MLIATAMQGMAATARRQPAAFHQFYGSADLAGPVMAFDRNAEIYGEGEPADYMYEVVKGAVREYQVLSDGRRQVRAFHVPGDVFAIEAGTEHSCSAETITVSQVAVVKRSLVMSAVSRDGEVARRFWRSTAIELDRSRRHSLLLIKTAQERVAAFLLDIAERLGAQSAVDLPMSRQDIADHLGMTIETVSRTLTHLEDAAVIELPAARHVVLRSRAALQRMADGREQSQVARRGELPCRGRLVDARLACDVRTAAA